MNINTNKDKTKPFITEFIKVNKNNISCDGGTDFGHPLVYLNLKKNGKIICPYCSRKFILKKK